MASRSIFYHRPLSPATWELCSELTPPGYPDEPLRSGDLVDVLTEAGAVVQLPVYFLECDPGQPYVYMCESIQGICDNDTYWNSLEHIASKNIQMHDEIRGILSQCEKVVFDA